MSTEQHQQPDTYSVFEEMEQEATLIYASTGQRFANHLVDTIVWYAFFISLFFIIGLIQRSTGIEIISIFADEYTEPTVWMYVLMGASWLGMYTIFEAAAKGRTIGKMITGTRAVNDDGTSLGLKKAFIRSLCRLIPFDALSALGGHPWHDTVSKTMVVKKQKFHA